MSKVKNIFAHFFEQSWLLLLCSFIFGLLIALANTAWSPRIRANEKAKLDTLMAGLISNAKEYEIVISQMEIINESGTITKTDIYKAEDDSGKTIGFAFVGTGAGFSGEIKLVIAVDSSCEKIFGYNVLQCTDSVGFGDRIDSKKDKFFASQFVGAPAGRFELLRAGSAENIDSQIVAISGATISSTAVVDIFNTYINTVKDKLKEKGFISDGK